MTFIKSPLYAALLVGAFALPALAQDRANAVKSIDVTVDMAAVQNADAAKYWGTLETDLETAILAKVADRTAEEGAEITVDLDEVSLASGFENATGLGDSRLSGLVKVSDPTQPGRGDSYELSVDVNAVRSIIGEDFDLTAVGADSSVVYKAMIDTYANQVVQNLK